MLRNLNVTLEEVLEVRDYPLDEHQLWALLRNIINVLSTTKDRSFSLVTEHILLFPHGNLKIIELSPSHKSESFVAQMHDVALVILKCASYNLDEEIPLNISTMLQNVLTSMCEKHDICTIDYLQDICSHQLNAQKFNDKQIISEMCSTILGNSILTNGFDLDDKLITCSTNLDTKSSSDFDDNSSFNSSSLASSRSIMSTMFGNVYDTAIPFSLGKTVSSDAEPKTISSKNKENFENKVIKQSSVPLMLHNIPKSVLKANQDIRSIYIDSSSASNDSTEIQVCYVNYSMVKLITSNPDATTVHDLLRSSLTVLHKNESTLSDSLLEYFALGAWKESDFYYFDNDTTLDKLLAQFSSPCGWMFHVRLLYFHPDIAALDSLLLNSMYVQVRADVVHERVLCSHDEVLAFAALSLQCEIGDYKPEYGCSYFTIEEFLPPHAVSKLGVSYLRSELPTMHKQLAGIAEKEAKLLFLKKNQNLDDYGMEFATVYRLKSCSKDHSTWLGIGPKGFMNFDIKDDISRIKRHSFHWNDLKKVSFKGRKIVITKLRPEYKLKFYLKNTSRTKYLVTLIGKLHKFYSINVMSRDLSALSLFDDITKISTNRNSTPTIRHSTPNPTSEQSSWTYNVPSFRRNTKVIRRPSSSAASSSSGSRDRITSGNSCPAKEPPITSDSVPGTSSGFKPGTNELVMNELKSVLKQESFYDKASSSSFFSDSDDQEVVGSMNDENTTSRSDVRPDLETQTVISQESAPSNSNEQNYDENIHVIARDFYRSSLPQYSLPLPPR